jgi:hypothetical protein
MLSGRRRIGTVLHFSPQVRRPLRVPVPVRKRTHRSGSAVAPGLAASINVDNRIRVHVLDPALSAGVAGGCDVGPENCRLAAGFLFGVVAMRTFSDWAMTKYPPWNLPKS